MDCIYVMFGICKFMFSRTLLKDQLLMASSRTGSHRIRRSLTACVLWWNRSWLFIFSLVTLFGQIRISLCHITRHQSEHNESNIQCISVMYQCSGFIHTYIHTFKSQTKHSRTFFSPNDTDVGCCHWVNNTGKHAKIYYIPTKFTSVTKQYNLVRANGRCSVVYICPPLCLGLVYFWLWVQIKWSN